MGIWLAPDPNPPIEHVGYAKWVDETLKVVVSRTLPSVSWNNTRLIRDNLEKQIRQIKEEVKADLLLLGSASLVATLLPLGLIDEFRVNVNPVILGSGIGFFSPSPDKSPLKLLDSRKFSSGVVGLHYQVVG
jgi:dihydrofolate reductase